MLDRDIGGAGRLENIGIGRVDEGILLPDEMEFFRKIGAKVPLRHHDVVEDPVDQRPAGEELLAEGIHIDGPTQVDPCGFSDEAENPFKSFFDGRLFRHISSQSPRGQSIAEATPGSNALFVTIFL